MMRSRRRVSGLLLFGLLLAGGCAEEAAVKQQTKVSGPGGETTVTKETRVESKGENPPVDLNKSQP
jgi:hypothetical protein